MLAVVALASSAMASMPPHPMVVDAEVSDGRAGLATAPAAKIPYSGQPLPLAERRKAILPAPTRAQAASLYNVNYVAGQTMPAMNWTGNVAACNPGSVSLAYQQSMIDRVNVYRALARIAPVSLYPSGDDKDERTAAAALLMAANGMLSHNPPSSWTCYGAAFAGSTVGALGDGGSNGGAGHSNLGWASNNMYATNAVIDAYMVDGGANNAQAGHRTGILDAQQTLMATGVIPSGAGNGSVNALWWVNFATRTAASPTPDGVAWPPGGFIPYQLLPAGSNRWSFQYPGANFSAATVTMSSGGAAYSPVVYDFRSSGCPSGYLCLPDDAIVWQPPLDATSVNGVSYASPGATDKTYDVTISGVSGSGVPATFSYTVTVIDPAFAPSILVSGTISNGATPVAGVTFCAQPATGVSCTASNASGAYSCTVPAGWSGMLHSPMVGSNRIPAQAFGSVTTAVTRNVAATTGVPTCNLDVDDNGRFDAATDGVAILRRMLGFGQPAFSGLAGACAGNTTAATIYAAANTSFNAGGYNATGGSATLPATDGAVILRTLLGLTGAAVTDGLGLDNESGATRTSWATLRPWFNATCGTNL